MIFRAPAAVAPEKLTRSLFIAGGIGGCDDWQSAFCARLDAKLGGAWTLLNPRRDNYPAHDADALRVQIGWEHAHLRAASALAFWFPPPTLCPITLYELGAWSHWRDAAGAAKPLFVAAHPAYAKRDDVKIQLGLERPEIEVVESLEALETQIVRALSALTPFNTP